MTKKQKELIDELVDKLSENEKQVFKEIIDYIINLGYIPQKQSVNDFILSFKHAINNKVIAKIGFRKQKGFISIKFFACENVPDKYIMALRDEADLNEERAIKNGKPASSGPVPDRNPIPSNTIMKQCTAGVCSICTGGSMRYYYQYPDGKEIFRCSAYPVLIPDLTEKDIDDLKRLLLEQHHYFLSIST